MKFSNIIIATFIINLMISPYSITYANEELLGTWRSLSGNIKFMSKNRYRSLIGSIGKWSTSNNNIDINGASYQYAISDNVNTGMQLLSLHSTNKNGVKNESIYFRKIPTRNVDRKLLSAIINQNAAQVKELINAGANPYTTDYDIGDETPAFQLALRLKNVEIIKILMPYTEKHMNSALFNAIDTNDTPTAMSLLAANINPNVTDNMLTTPLMHAAVLGNLEIVNELIKSGAKIQNYDGHGSSTMSYARRAITNNKEIVSLIEKNCPQC